MNRRVLLDEFAQNSKRHRRPAKYREMKAGERKIKFDKSFVARVFSRALLAFRGILESLSQGHKDAGFFIVKIVRVEVSVLATLTLLDIKKR